MTREPLPRLHAVATAEIVALPDFDDRASRIAAQGAVAIHVRGRGLAGRAVAEAAERVRAAAPDATLLINDRADVAKAVNAAGVHLPEAGIPTPQVRAFLGHTVWIGRSVHDPAGIPAALDQGADYAFLGPMWPTPSHPGTPGLGPGVLAGLAGQTVLVIGGVSLDRIEIVRQAGAYGVATVRSLWLADDPGSMAREMLLSLEVEYHD